MTSIGTGGNAFDRLFNRPVRCGACRRPPEMAGRLVDGPWVYICESCLREAVGVTATPRWPMRCSFCGFGNRSFAGVWPGFAICTECAAIARSVLADEDGISPMPPNV